MLTVSRILAVVAAAGVCKTLNRFKAHKTWSEIAVKSLIWKL